MTPRHLSPADWLAIGVVAAIVVIAFAAHLGGAI